MKALVLTAGYAVRLRPLTLDRPKALLPIGKKTVLDLIIEKIEAAREIDEIVILSNEKFLCQFERWASGRAASKPIVILSDGTTSEEDKLGAVGDLAFSIREHAINDDLLVLAGDNIFDFNLNDFIAYAVSAYPYPVIALHDVGSREAARRYGVVGIDDQHRVVSLEEKPAHPRSTLVSMCLYFFPKDTVPLVFDYLAATDNPDQTGVYIKWLITQTHVFGFYFSGRWYDIGNLQTYQQAIDDIIGAGPAG
ncbi:MAG: nucleotidyltransferase family protein [Candidatus Omnitrophica bacterium]|nr:nucleotidyltransferase family protein [Candidatus Omnitrophota bacterium]